MKNEEIFKILELLGSIRNTATMFIENENKLLNASIMYIENNTLYICSDNDISQTADFYYRYIENEALFEEFDTSYQYNLDKLLDLDVKIFLGDFLKEDPSKSENVKPVVNALYSNNTFILTC